MSRSLSSIGDINGDGIEDFIIGAPNADPNSRSSSGAAYVIFGRGSGTSWTNIDLNSATEFVSGTTGFIIEGAAIGDDLGVSVSGLGDINGDGIEGFIIGASDANPNSRSDSGAAYVIFGRGSGASWTNMDLNSATEFVSGTTGFIIEGAAIGDDLGVSVSGLGDINGDGIEDFIIGAPFADPNSRSSSGAAYVIFGRGSGTSWTNIDLNSATEFVSGTTGFVIEGAANSDRLGFSVSGLGDINGDGIEDFIVGALTADPNSRSNSGAAYVIFGRGSGTSWTNIDLNSATEFVSGTTGFIIEGAASSDNLGATVSNLGDVNSDGVDDFIIGANNGVDGNFGDFGSAYVFFGTCLSNDYELPNVTTFALNICTASANIVDVNNIATSLTVTSRLLSQSGKIDLSGSYTLLTLSGTTLTANSFTGQGAAIDLSGTASLTFTGTNTLDAGTRDIALPSGFVVSGTPPTITANTVTYGTASGDQEISVSPVILPSATTGDITTSVVTLVVNENLTSTMGMIDLTGATTALTVDGATLDASSFTGIGAAIDLSGTASLTFTGTNILDAGTKDIALPSGFVISGTLPAIRANAVTYGTASGNQEISVSPVILPSATAGDITTSVLTLVINENLASTTGRINLTGATTSLTVDGATLDASGFTGTGAAIDLSGTASLTFTGTNALDAVQGT